MKNFKDFLKEQTTKEFRGIHYSNHPNLDELTGDSYGKGLSGAEAKRLAYTLDPRIKRRVYFYPHTEVAGHLPKPEGGLGPHVYTANISNLLDARDKEAVGKVAALKGKYLDEGEPDGNAFESALLDSGFDGYHTPDMAVVLNKNVPVEYLGHVRDLT